jgi:ADP-ribosylglycohydrolase
MNLSEAALREKMLGCWLGKAVGGTLGLPFEGENGPLDLDYYRPVPTTMLPNDDLDLQVVWACMIDRLATPRVDMADLGAAWLRHVTCPCDEYGVSLRNLARGITPPFSGICDNWFNNGMGGAIRSELWACLAPGLPSVAAEYAYHDACTDHSGDGVWAEVFLAAMEALCFRIDDLPEIIVRACSFIPVESRIRTMAIDVLAWSEHHDWLQVRAMILEKYEHPNFTDTVQNLAFILLGLLAGDGNFGNTICIAVNCGKDTDCTGATAGAIFGILHPERIDDKWLKPIGRSLLLSPGFKDVHHPPTLDGFADLVARLGDRLAKARGGDGFPEPPLTKAMVSHLAEAKYPQAGHDLDEALAAELAATGQATLFPGTYARIPRRLHDDRILAVTYRLDVKAARKVRIMFSANQETRVFLDGKFICGGQRWMIPSFHRAGTGHVADVDVTAGIHTLTALVRTVVDADTEWVLGLGDPATNLWLSDGSAEVMSLP